MLCVLAIHSEAQAGALFGPECEHRSAKEVFQMQTVARRRTASHPPRRQIQVDSHSGELAGRHQEGR